MTGEGALNRTLVALLHNLESEDAEVRQIAARDGVGLLEETRDLARYSAVLRVALGSNDVLVRRIVASGLREIALLGIDLQPAARFCARGLEEADDVTRRALAEVIASGAETGRAEVARLTRRALADPDEQVRAVVARALGRFADAGEDLTAHLPGLVARLEDRAPEVRDAAMHALDAYARQGGERAARVHLLYRAVCRIARARDADG